jgi:hypothetical protein
VPTIVALLLVFLSLLSGALWLIGGFRFYRRLHVDGTPLSELDFRKIAKPWPFLWREIVVDSLVFLWPIAVVLPVRARARWARFAGVDQWWTEAKGTDSQPPRTGP